MPLQLKDSERASESGPRRPSDAAPLLEEGHLNLSSSDNSNSQQQADPTFTIISTLIAAFGPLSFGYALGYTSPTYESIKQQWQLSDGQASFFGALVNLGAVIGAMVSGLLADAFGRKGALGSAALPGMLGWVLVSAAQAPVMLYAGRVLIGFGVGVVSFSVPVYIAEISPGHLRGGLGATNQLAITVGIMLVYALGMVVQWRALAMLGTVPLIGLLLGLLVIPESPRWLAKHGAKDKLQSSLQRLRGKTCDVSGEVQEIEEAVRATANQPRASLGDLLDKNLRLPLIIGVGLMILQQFSGINAVMFYSGSIFAAAGVGSANAAAFAVGLLQVFMTALACWLMDKAGRRPLLLVSAGTMAVSIFVLGLTFFFKSPDAGATKGGSFFSTLAILSLLVYIAGFSMGIGAIPWIIMSEVFPVQVRGLAGSIATLINWLCSFTVTQTFQLLLNWSAPGAFWLYAAECAVAVIFVGCLVPETRLKTLEEIEASFRVS